MSDDRFQREPGDDTDEIENEAPPEFPEQKTKRWYQDVKPRTITPEEIFGWLDNVYCKVTGAKPGRPAGRGKP